MQGSGSLRVAHRAAAELTSPGNLLGMKILRPHSRPTKSERQEVRAASVF